MHKILVFGMTENPGGVESFLYNYISEMNLAEFQFDFLCNSYEKVAYEDKLIQRNMPENTESRRELSTATIQKTWIPGFVEFFTI